MVRLRSQGIDTLAAVVVKSSGETGSVRQLELANWRNQVYDETFKRELGLLPKTPEFAFPYGIVVAPYITPRAAALCREIGFGYCDFAGNCFLAFEQVYILRENWPNPAKRIATVSLWSPRSERILRVLLENPDRSWKTQSLAEEAQVSAGLVSSVRSQLADREWIAKNSLGFFLIEPITLLQEWGRTRKSNDLASSSFIPSQA